MTTSTSARRSPRVGASDGPCRTPAPRIVAEDRDESDACQRSTPGCCIDHSADAGSCETW